MALNGKSILKEDRDYAKEALDKEERNRDIEYSIHACIAADPKGYLEAHSIQSQHMAKLQAAHLSTNCVPKSKATSQNPKDLLGMKKPDMTKIPSFALAHEAMAMMDGGSKYGPYNWRDKAVAASIYIAACKRHLDLWFERQEFAEDSGVHHLGHARACLGILIDAIETGNLVDDRPGDSETASKLEKVWKQNMERWTKAVEKREAEKKQPK